MTLFGAAEFAEATNVSRETLAHLKIYASMLVDWNSKHNLVSKASLGDLWRRHFLDSAQLADCVPNSAQSLVDLGSGAGFPGLVLAELLRKRHMRVVLFEATRKKADFLRSVVLRLRLDAEVRSGRIEDAAPEAFDVITARACAPLDQLLAYSSRFWGATSLGIFPKGQNVEAELTAASKSWKIKLERRPSRSDPSGVILLVEGLTRAGS